MPLGLKSTLARGLQFYIELYNVNVLPISAGIIPGSSFTKIFEMVLIGCISRSRGQKLGYQKSSCLKLQGPNFHIWYITSSRCLLPIFGGQH